MKKIFLSFLFSIFLIFSASAESIKIAALVNGEIISSEDLADQLNIFMLNSPIPYNAQTAQMRPYPTTLKQPK